MRKSGSSAVVDAVATSDSETEKMQHTPLPRAIWLMSLILFGLGILIIKHVLGSAEEGGCRILSGTLGCLLISLVVLRRYLPMQCWGPKTATKD